MDNKQIDIISEGNDDLKSTLKLIWGDSKTKVIQYMYTRLKTETSYFGDPVDSHYTSSQISAKGVPILILFKWDATNAMKLPYPMDLDDSFSFIKGWLKNVDYGQEPDHDGTNNHGWRVFTERWGNVAGYSSAMVGIQPAWAMYGK